MTILFEHSNDKIFKNGVQLPTTLIDGEFAVLLAEDEGNQYWGVHSVGDEFEQIEYYWHWCITSKNDLVIRYEDRMTSTGHDLVRVYNEILFCIENN